MAFSQAGNSIVKRYQIAASIVTRSTASGPSYAQDSYIQNAYVAKDPQSEDLLVIKRPALQPAFTTGASASSTPQAFFAYFVNGQQTLWAITNNVLYNVTASGASYGSSTVGAWASVTPSPVLNFVLGSSSSPTGAGYLTASSIVFREQMMLVGGYTSAGKFSAAVTASTDGRNWKALTNAAQWADLSLSSPGRTGMCLAVMDDRLWMMGGQPLASILAPQYFNDVWVTDDGRDWFPVTGDMGTPQGILPRSRAACVTFKGNIYLLGGQTLPTPGVSGTPTVVNDIVSTADGSNWTLGVAPAWSARIDHAACVFNGAIYVIGGNNKVSGFTDCWRSYDGINWTNVYSSGLGSGRSFSALHVYANKMYAIAYYQFGVGNVAEIYSSSDGVTWTALSAPPWTSGVLEPSFVFAPPTNYYPVDYPGATINIVDTAANTQHFATLNSPYSASFAIGTAAPTTARYDNATLADNRYLVVKNQYDAWVFTANQISKIVDVNYPYATVPGLVNLNNRLYVMDARANIYGSDINNPYSWSGLNFIQADYENDVPVALAKMLNYVVAFKTRSTQFYMANGAAVGNTISPVTNANGQFGCGSSGSIVEMDRTIYFISSLRGFGRTISRLNGFVPEQISSPDIDRLLNANPLTNVYAYNLRIDGQSFYVLNLTDSPQYTLVFNSETGHWSVWACGTDGVSTGTKPFRGVFAANIGYPAVHDRLTNGIYQVTSSSYRDTDQSAVNTDITVIAQPVKVDMNTNQFKFCASVDLIGDKYSSSNPVTVQYSDDDWITTTTWGTCDLSLDRPQIYRGGSFRRRGMRFTHTANMPLRVQAYELTMEPGDV